MPPFARTLFSNFQTCQRNVSLHRSLFFQAGRLRRPLSCLAQSPVLPAKATIVGRVKSASEPHAIRPRMPTGSWDSHMHILDAENYPLVPNAQYIPHSHFLEEALEREAELGIDNIVMVQPSVYGHDNSCMIDGLRRVGPRRARAVVSFDPLTIDRATLDAWHELGVRGVRVNFVSIGKKVDELELKQQLYQYADLIRPLGWVLQLYIPLSAVEALERILPSLDIKVCLDHFASPSIPDSSTCEQLHPQLVSNLSSLTRLLRDSETFVKISAYYRLCKNPAQLEPFARVLLGVADGRKVLFGTDWPHTRYSGLKIEQFVQVVLDWCQGDQKLINQVFRDNAALLWDAEK